jgi:myo-inositol-1(or 4)-monophosphatase
MPSLPVSLDDILPVARAAGDILRGHNARPREVRFKGRIDLVTAADLAIEAFLREHLVAMLPGSTFLGEEGSPQTVPSGYTWVVDPVDGTTNFAHGLPFVAISIALCREGEVLLGIVNAPLIGECFTAVRGGGAWRNGGPMRVSATGSLERSLIATGFPYAMDGELPGLLARMGRVLSASQGVRRYGAAAIDLAFVAAGHYDGFYERRLNPWDVAAGWLLVTEAGGVMTRTTGESFHLFAHDVLATNGAIHEELRGCMYAEGEMR